MLNSTVSPSPAPPLSLSTPSPHRWSPNTNDHLIFDWVKMQGKTQAEVASLLNISQPTVCRVIQRYERWIAHLKNREDGRLDPQERLRAQRQLTYDRNELILASCLRIAQDMEGSLDGTRSVVSRPMSNFPDEREMRTTHFTVDRTPTVCRYLRLAHRINMEQEKLATRMAREGEAPAEPLSDQELAVQAHQAALDDAEIARSKCFSPLPPDPVGWVPTTDSSNDPVAAPAASPLSPQRELGEDQSTDQLSQSREAAIQVPPIDTPPPTSNLEPETLNSPPTLNTVNNLNSNSPLHITSTPAQPCTCIIQLDSQKISHTCITDYDPPTSPPTDSPKSKRRRPKRAAVS